MATTFWLGPFGDDPAERIIDEAELQQVGGERGQRDDRRKRGAGAAGQRINGESQQQRRGGQQVRLEDRAGADEPFDLGVQAELPQGGRNTPPRAAPPRWWVPAGRCRLPGRECDRATWR